MSDTQETGAEVIAEYRADADKMDSHELPQPTTQYLRIMLARIEVALRRERGDVAKLREALEAIISGYENADLCDTNYGEWCHEPANPCVNVSLCKAIHESRVALSAPPRNCDLPEVAKDPWRAWLDDESNWEDGNPKLEIHDWLLAPATEKEGGAK